MMRCWRAGSCMVIAAATLILGTSQRRLHRCFYGASRKRMVARESRFSGIKLSQRQLLSSPQPRSTNPQSSLRASGLPSASRSSNLMRRGSIASYCSETKNTDGCPSTEWEMDDSTCDSIRSFWFSSSENWFSASETFDKIVLEKFEESLLSFLAVPKAVVAENFSKWLESKPSKDIMSHIILWDQISRHYRRCRYSDEAVISCSPLAVNATRYLLEFRMEEIDKWNTAEKVFVLMPWRHLFTVEALSNVLLWKRRWQSYPDEDNALWERFEKATLKALSTAVTKEIEPIPRRNSEQLANVSWREFSEILEYTPEISNTLNAISGRREMKDGHRGDSSAYCNSVNSVGRFLQRKVSTDPKNEMSQTSQEQPRVLVVSISGGVDSMVLTYAAWYALGSNTLKNNVKLVCAHINYGNRITADHEETFVRQYCELLGIELYVRKISEIKRTRDKDRNFYEDITREIRFETYKTIIQKTLRSLGYSESEIDTNWNKNPVLLGHNRQDTWENLISNIAKGQKYETLRGMEAEGHEQGVKIWRPLLETNKSDIYNDAQSLGIPHLWDSTPKWCDRGRYRDEILPFLQEHTPQLIPGLERLADHMNFLTKAWNEKLEEYWKEIKFDDDPSLKSREARMPLHEWMYIAPVSSFWSPLFKVLFDRWNIPPPSHKAMDHLREWMIKARENGGRIRGRIPQFELSKNYHAVYGPAAELTIKVRKQVTDSSVRIRRAQQKKDQASKEK